jgi:hypothetical protein
MRSASVFRPRSARKLSNGPATPPTAFCKYASCSASGASRSSLPITTTPPMMSEWPLRYLVAECTTMSKPCSSGRWIQGLAKVLSATAISLRSCAIFATASRSISLSRGLLGVSIQIIFVSGRIAAERRAGSDMSTKVVERLAERLRTFSNNR